MREDEGVSAGRAPPRANGGSGQLGGGNEINKTNVFLVGKVCD